MSFQERAKINSKETSPLHCSLGIKQSPDIVLWQKTGMNRIMKGKMGLGTRSLSPYIPTPWPPHKGRTLKHPVADLSFLLPASEEGRLGEGRGFGI